MDILLIIGTKSNDSLERPSNMGTEATIIAVIVSIITLIVAGIVILLCYKCLKHRWPHNEDPRPADEEVNANVQIVDYRDGNREVDITHAVANDESEEVTTPEVETSNLTVMITGTCGRAQRNNRYYKNRRGYESGDRSSEEDTVMQDHVKAIPSQLGEVIDQEVMSAGSVKLSSSCQEIDENSTSCLINTMVKFDHYYCIADTL